MSFASKHNNVRKFNVDTTGFEYASMADLYNQHGADHVYPLCGLYINSKGKFGDQPLAATDTSYVNFPSYMLSEVKTIIDDADDVAEINAGRVGFKIYSYANQKYKRDCFGIEFVDIVK